MSEVSRALSSAFSYSIISNGVISMNDTWGDRFPRVQFYDPVSHWRVPAYKCVERVLAAYTEQEIITILAAARLEGVWTPE